MGDIQLGNYSNIFMNLGDDKELLDKILKILEN